LIVLELDYNNYSDLLQSLARQIGAEVKDSRIIFPDKFGSGFMQLYDLPNGLQALVSDIEYHDDVLFSRKHKDDYYFVIHFNDMRLTGSIDFLTKGKTLKDESEYRAGVTLSSSLFDLDYSVKAYTHSKTINVHLTKEWLTSYLDLKDSMQVINDYLQLRNTLMHPEPFDAQHRMLFDEIFSSDNQNPMKSMIIKNRIMLLVEHFLAKLYRSINTITYEKKNKIKTSDLGKLMEIEAELVKDFSKPPPTINELAQKTGMSISKLKNVYKKVYGTGIYEYYQKNRMQKARSMLLTGQYNVKEVGLQLGYTNLSNFSLAFKKEFGVLPSQL
jgi:AraC-like DNA-binding protein